MNYTPCDGSGKAAVNLHYTEVIYDDLPGYGRVAVGGNNTYGECCSCGRVARTKGRAAVITLVRHKAQITA